MELFCLIWCQSLSGFGYFFCYKEVLKDRSMFDDDGVDVCNCIHSALSLLWSEGGNCTHSGRRKGGMCPEWMGRSSSH